MIPTFLPLRGEKVQKLALFVCFVILTSYYFFNNSHYTKTTSDTSVPVPILASSSSPSRSQAEQVLVDVPNCQCKKWINAKPLSNPKYTPVNGTCSDISFRRGAGQKVVGFTFYEPTAGENAVGEDKSLREYFEGIQENVDLVRKFYGPEWVVRVYYQVSSNSSTLDKLCDLTCSEPSLDICDANYNPRLGNTTILFPLLWRFLPVIDVNVDLFLSRDLDSRINPREVAAVQEFLNSDKDLHVMRDHPAHSAFMMGGTWGAKVNHQRDNFLVAFKKLFKDAIAYIDRVSGGGYDQIALVRYVWPWGKKVAISHDSYTCHKFPRTSAFPTQRVAGVGNFIGSVVSLNSSIGLDEGGICPEKCRPKDHKDWKYC